MHMIPDEGIKNCVYPKKEGKKFDKNKLRFDLIPVIPLALVAEVYTLGAKKYGDRNWESGINWTRIMGALERHYNSWKAGEKCDQEDGQHHLSSVVWCALALMEYESTSLDFDDRGNLPLKNKTLLEAIEEAKQNACKQK